VFSSNLKTGDEELQAIIYHNEGYQHKLVHWIARSQHDEVESWFHVGLSPSIEHNHLNYKERKRERNSTTSLSD
jgi:hypothetical protein